MKTVSVAIPVHNEAQNITFLLRSILKQKNGGFVLEKIFVLCDGTTDGMQTIVAELAAEHNAIKVIDDGQHLGKSARLNQAFRLNTSDLLLSFDGDVLLNDNQVIANIVTCFDDNEVVLVGGNAQVVKPSSLVGTLVYTNERIWYEAKHNVNAGDNVYNMRGCVWAARQSFIENLVIPETMFSSTHYLYFYAKKAGKKFAFAQHAVVLYRLPDNIQDYLTMVGRATRQQDNEAAQLFSSEYSTAYQIPFAKKLHALVSLMATSPFLAIASIMFSLFMRFIPQRHLKQHTSGKWQAIASTKKPIVRESE